MLTREQSAPTAAKDKAKAKARVSESSDDDDMPAVSPGRMAGEKPAYRALMFTASVPG